MVTYPKDWDEKKINEIALINPPSEVPLKFKYVDLESVKGVSLLSTRIERKNTAPSRAQRLAQLEDIFFQTVRPYQRNNYFFERTDGKYVFSTGYAQLRAYCNPKFLFYLLQQDSFVEEVINNCTGTSYPAINPKRLGEIKVFLPQDIEEQKAIAATISSFDTHIDNLTALIAKKKAIRDGALEDLMSGRTRLEGFSGEWEEKTLDYLALIINGDRGVNYPSDADFKQHGIPFINAGHLKNGIVNWDEMDYISNEHYANLGGGKIKKYDILFCLRGSLGKYAMVGFNEGAPASSLCIIRPNQYTDAKFLMYIVGSEKTKFQIANVNTGSSQPNLSAKDVSKFTYTIPIDVDEQKAIADILTSMDTEIQNLATERDKFIQIREGAMDDLLTGRVRLSA